MQPDRHPATARELTTPQRRLWTGQQVNPDSPHYNTAMAFRIDGALDRDRFREAFDRLVEHTDALRTTFHQTANGPVRIVSNQTPSPLRVVDFAGEEEALEKEVQRLTQIPFQLDGPLYESVLFRLGPERHVWYLNQHHLITDFWSTSLIFRRMAELYAGQATPDWPSYEAFVEAERALSGSPQAVEAATFWRGFAERSSGPTPFYGRAAGKSASRSRSVVIPFGPDRSRAVLELASQPGFRAISSDLALFQIFATLLFGLIRRVGDDARPGIAVPAHNRTSAEAREMAGLLVELFPFDVEVEDSDTFRSLALRVAAANQGRLRHILPGCSPEASGRDVVLNFMRGGFGDLAGMTAEARWLRPNAIDAGCALRLHVFDFKASGEMQVELDLNESVFGQIERKWLAADFLALADAMLADPTRPLLEVELPSSRDGATWLPQPIEAEVPTLESLLRGAATSPDAIAVQDAGASMGYAELWARIGGLAHEMRAAGAAPGRQVGILLPCSAELVVAILATLETGAAYVPLDPASPRNRLQGILDDAAADLLLTSEDLEQTAAAFDRRTIVVGSQSSHEYAEPSRFDPDSLAYILYTSGSSGRPKGVEVTRASLANYLHWAAGRYSDGSPVSLPLFTSPAFDLTVTSVFTPIVTGGTVVAYRGESGNDPFLVRQVFQDDQVDVVKLTPSHLALIRDLPLNECRVRRLILGGEELTLEAARSIHERSGGKIEICNEYGPTEATVGCMIHPFDPADAQTRTVPIGVPIANTEIDVLDSYGRPAPRGVTGEIVIRGRGVARGYRNLPDESRERFKNGAYRTGDLGRWRADGILEFHGRRDLQIKWRGARIELGEVEAALASHPAVEICAAALVRPVSEDHRHCVRCGLEAPHPEARLDREGVCAVCRLFAEQRERVAGYFGGMQDLERILSEAKAGTTGPHDCLMLYSGGKDSTYALAKIVEMGARPLVYHFDNGYISEESKQNVRRVVEQLGLDLYVGQTPAMDQIFADSLRRYSNVCNGCFKAIYTLSTNLARERGIRHIITGLSRGQIFETRLADLYRRGIQDTAIIDAHVLEARKVYHRMDDAVARLLDVRAFEEEAVFDEVRFVDFYRYCDDTLDRILAYLEERTPWIRPSDTGRSTNCRINDVGIFVHKTERGFHNYSLPYSWDVRLGHKQREAALAELDDEIDVSTVREILRGIGYRERPRDGASEARLAIYWVGDAAVSTTDLRRHVARELPPEAIPAAFIRLDELPLTDRHKIDRRALPEPGAQRPMLERAYVAPASDIERLLVEIWEQTLGIEPIGVEDDFFELGGDSIHAIQAVAQLRQQGLSLVPRDIFEHPLIADLAPLVRSGIHDSNPAPAAEGASSDEWAEVLDEFGE